MNNDEGTKNVEKNKSISNNTKLKLVKALVWPVGPNVIRMRSMDIEQSKGKKNASF